MEESQPENKMGYAYPVNIPIQMILVADTTGQMTPLRFRFEKADHQIETVRISRTISRDESNYVGIREKRFICSAEMDGHMRLLELRYNVGKQTWRIFQFLS